MHSTSATEPKEKQQEDLKRVVKGNSRLLLGVQGFTTVSFQINSLVGSLAVYAITHNFAFSGLVISVPFVGRIIAPYFTGWIMDRNGRRPVLVLGCILVAASLFGLALAYLSRNVSLVLILFLSYGIGNAILNQIRVAMADMYPVTGVGAAIGYLYTASIIGSLVAPVLVALEGAFPEVLGIDQFAALWIIGALTVVPAAVSVYLIRPDTAEVARLMGFASRFEDESKDSVRPSISAIAPPFTVSAVTWGIMIAMMSLLSLDMGMTGFPLYLISLTITIHVIGMYAPSLPFGRITDKFGAKGVMVAGAIITGIGGLITPLTTNYYVITIGMFLVGVGWSGATISSTATLTSMTEVSLRGRVLGLNDVANSVASVVCPFVGGALVGVYGSLGLGLFGFALSLPATFFGILKLRTS